MATKNQTQRVNFSAMQKQMPYPDFLDIQLKSFREFVQMDATTKWTNHAIPSKNAFFVD